MTSPTSHEDREGLLEKPRRCSHGDDASQHHIKDNDSSSRTVAYLRRRYDHAQNAIWGLSMAYLLSLTFFIIIYLQMKDHTLRCRSLDLFPSLAQDANVVQFERVKLPVKLAHNPLVGNPTPALDHAWHSLFEDVNIRITTQDLAHAQVDSLKLADGSGDAIGLLGMHHELHCLKRIRRWIYRDYYYPNLTSDMDAFTENKVHVDHCIELLRVSIMCHADTSLSTFEWLHVQQAVGPSAHDKAYHSCVKLDPLLDWVHARSVDLSQSDLLVKPEFEAVT